MSIDINDNSMIAVTLTEIKKIRITSRFSLWAKRIKRHKNHNNKLVRHDNELMDDMNFVKLS